MIDFCLNTMQDELNTSMTVPMQFLLYVVTRSIWWQQACLGPNREDP